VDDRKRRLFVGIALDDRTRAACAAISEQLQKAGFAARYEAPEKLHATLAFLGYVPAQQYREVVSALAAAAQTARFTVRLDKLGGFPHERRPRIVYIGAREQGAPFRALSARVRGAYAALDFEFKNDTVAHVTIGRVKAPREPLPLIGVSPIALHVKGLTLFESLPDRAHNTSRYEELQTVALTASARAETIEA
jgi:2'-5' RNA ligase